MRAVIADDSLLVREGIVRVLEDGGFEGAGQAGDVDGLLALLASTSPDVAIIDIRMPPTFTDEGLRALVTIREQHGQAIGILVLSHHTEAAFALRLLADGADGTGYLLKAFLRRRVPMATRRARCHVSKDRAGGRGSPSG